MSVSAPVRDLFAGMNKLERRRAVELEAMKRSRQIAEWWYERLTLKLADDTRYTPDFLVQELDGSLRLEETKGHMREDAHVKVKVCAALFPFPLRVMVWEASGWQITEY